MQCTEKLVKQLLEMFKLQRPMKKIFVTLFLLILSCGVYAQTEHMKFMGIPINGSISNFQQKLEAKGVKLDKLISPQLPVGMRVYDGVFSGERARIYVYFDEKTKTVYRAKAVIENITKGNAENKFEKFASMLKEKYINGYAKDSEQDGYPSLCIGILEANNEDFLGFVSMYMNNPRDVLDDSVFLHIDYEDEKNSQSHKNNNMDDL